MEIRMHDVILKCHKTRAYVSITKHPYYVCLNEWNPTIYNEYTGHSSYQSLKPSGSWLGFVKLARELLINGLVVNAKDPIQIEPSRHGWRCTHGKHRACILMFLSEPDTTLMVEDGIVIDVRPPPSYNTPPHIIKFATLFTV